MSVLTLTFDILNLEFPKNLLGFEIPSGSDFKIWLLILVASAYVFIRYHNSSEAQALRVNYLNGLLPFYNKANIKFIDIAIKLYHRSLPLPHFMRGAIDRLIEEANDVSPIPVRRVKIQAFQLLAHDPTISGRTNILELIYYYDHDTDEVDAQSSKRAYRPSKLLNRCARVYANLRVAIRLQILIDLLVPYGMFLVSCMSLFWRLGSMAAPLLGTYVIWGTKI